VSRPEPEPEQGTGLYVYGVVADAPDGLTDGLASVVPDAGVRLLEGGGVQALVTDVPLSEYGEAALRENLNRMEWLQATAVAHETVLEQILGRAELIPFRLCTVFAGEASLVAMLEGERRTFRHTLGRIRGATEWGVKAVAGMPVEAPAGAGDGASEGGEGASYFAARREERERATQVRQLLGNVADEAHARLSEAARAATLHRAQSKELGGYEGRMVLNGSYLVDDDHAHAFGEMVGELDARYREVGVRFELTGPWPPYNFTDEVDAEPR
jgi:hypothetical protein